MEMALRHVNKSQVVAQPPRAAMLPFCYHQGALAALCYTRPAPFFRRRICRMSPAFFLPAPAARPGSAADGRDAPLERAVEARRLELDRLRDALEGLLLQLLDAPFYAGHVQNPFGPPGRNTPAG